MLRASALLALASFMLAACDQPTSKDVQVKLSASEQRVAGLEMTVAQLKMQLTALDARAAKLESAQSLREVIDQFKGVAYLTPGSEGYEVIEYSLGSLAVSLDDVRPYANGSRVTLTFGNPTSAMVTGISMDLEWGKSAGDAETTKSRHLTMQENLRGGVWTKVPVVLEGVPPTDLGFVRVKNFKNGGVSLLTIRQ